MKNMQIVSDDEMQLLQINAMSQLFFKKIESISGKNSLLQEGSQSTSGGNKIITLTGQ
jgi:hypothetical protein